MSSHARNTTETTDDEQRQLDVLGDECARTILVAASSRPRTAKELTSLTDCSSATVYRRINNLLDIGLMRERIRFDDETKQKTAYETIVGHVCVDIDEHGIEVDSFERASGPERAVAALERLPFERVQVDVERDRLEARIELSPDELEQFDEHWMEANVR